MSNSWPIIFSGPMVRVILEGRKTQTRRIAKVTDDGCSPGFITPTCGFVPRRIEDHVAYCPFGQPGDRLWVREAHAIVPATAYRASTGVAQTVNPQDTYYAAVYREGFDRARCFSWKPSIHMPRWASRITLEITEIWVQRLQEINEEDAQAEGVEGGLAEFGPLWDQINTAPGRTWEDNPWVWVIGFRRVQQ